MTLSLKNLIRRFLYGFKSDSNGLPRGKERAAPSAQRTVLFVDDEPSILNMRRIIFETLGYSVLTAISGEQALEVLELHSVDAVVLDYLMPGMDGEETARCIRKLRGDVPIILSTGCLNLPQHALKVVTAAVEKGAGPEALIQALEQHLSPLLHPTTIPDREACAY